MKCYPWATACSLLPLLFASLPVSAKENYGINLSFNSRYSDNAEKSPDAPYSEWQDRYELGAFGNYENALIDVGANYQLSDNRFEKDSQADRRIAEGDSHFRLGKEYHLADLLLTHSRRTLRTDPNQIDLLDNLDERQMISAVPSLHLGVTSADVLWLSGSYTRVDYRFNEERNADYKGGSFMYRRKQSAVGHLDLTLQQTDVSFESSSDTDYRYQSSMLSYSVRLRNLVYTLAAGYNRIERDAGGKESGPALRVEATYDTGLNQLSVYGDQRITDTSLGDGNRGDFDIPRPGDVGAGTLDQIERRNLELRWSTRALCDRCDLGANLGSREDKYLTLNRDNREDTAGISAGYRLTRASSLGLRWSWFEQRFSTEEEKFRVERAQIHYQYNFANNIGLGLFVEHEKRKSDSGIFDYDESASGLSFTYHY